MSLPKRGSREFHKFSRKLQKTREDKKRKLTIY